MRHLAPRLAGLLLGAALAVPGLAQAQSFSANYDLTHTAGAAWNDADLLPGRMFSLAGMRMGPAFGHAMGAGAGLSLEAGEAWFGRLTVGRSVELNQLSLAGGYRWADGQSVSLQFTRGRLQDRLGLSVRYDWPRYYVRLGFDPRNGEGSVDMLRFSAGVRF